MINPQGDLIDTRRRGKGHEPITFLDAIEELKMLSNPNRMPHFTTL